MSRIRSNRARRLSWWTPKIPRRVELLLAGLLVLGTLGCGSDSAPSGDVLDESWFSLNGETSSAPNAPASQTETRARLGLALEEGARFPLHKVVEKTLTQLTPQGPMESTERIEMFMAVTVEEIRGRSKKFRILYSRVKYDSQIGNERVHYDSQQPSHSLSESVLAYHGMVNNGFSFWVGADNRVTDVVDFNEFLRRCLAQVPAQKSEAVSEILAQYSGQEGIANFVDDTIGLLPYDPDSKDGTSVVRLGGHWSKSRHFNEPVPMSLNNTYTLKDLNEEIAKIEILGDVVPAAAVSNPRQDVSLQILRGHSAGTCTIDRKTGLPLNSRIDHQMSMNVQLNGLQFEQQKRVVTSIRMFPEQSDQRLEQFAFGEEEAGPAGLNLTPASHSEYR